MLAHTGRAEARDGGPGGGPGSARPGRRRTDARPRGRRPRASPSARPAGLETTEDEAGAGEGCELVLVIGGDGTILRAAEITHETGTPLLGVNLGHVGFLAEAEQDDVGR